MFLLFLVNSLFFPVEKGIRGKKQIPGYRRETPMYCVFLASNKTIQSRKKIFVNSVLVLLLYYCNFGELFLLLLATIEEYVLRNDAEMY